MQPVEERVRKRLAGLLQGDGLLDTVLRRIPYDKGKLLRPRLVALSLQACGGELDDRGVDVAAGVELVHLASLIHDDILDRSEMRRGHPSVQAVFGPSVAVLTGDYLFALAFSLFTAHNTPDVLATMTRVIRDMCEGEIDQLLGQGLTEETYWRYIYQKTASLVAGSCRVGAYLAGPKGYAYAEDLAYFGEKLGYSFQLIDDLLEYRGDAQSLGKNPGDDFQAEVWTLPIIRAVDRHTIPKDWYLTLDWPELREQLNRQGIVNELFAEAVRLAEQAQASLRTLPDSPHKVDLINLAQFLVQRVS